MSARKQAEVLCTEEQVSSKVQGSEMYAVKDIAKILGVSERKAYDFCNTTDKFVVLRVGRTIRIPIKPFRAWMNGESDENATTEGRWNGWHR